MARCTATRRCSEVIRKGNLMDSPLTGEANILICPNIDAANILFNVLKAVGAEGTTVGPILMGVAEPAHVLTPSSTVRRVLNMTALAAAQAGQHVVRGDAANGASAARRAGKRPTRRPSNRRPVAFAGDVPQHAHACHRAASGVT